MRHIYLHGFASSPASRKAQFFKEKMAEAGSVLEIPELTPPEVQGGFGSLTITGQLRVVEELAAGEPVTMWGSSMGGYLAALYASMHPETSRVVMLAPAFDFARRWRERLGRAVFEEWQRTGWLNVFHYGAARDERVGFGLIEDALRHPGFPVVTQPALVFHGRQDDIVPQALVDEWVRRTPQAEYHLLDSGHELTDCMEYMWVHSRRFVLP
jgi:uncharacterized protein